jgi:hypothetical protein
VVQNRTVGACMDRKSKMVLEAYREKEAEGQWEK